MAKKSFLRKKLRKETKNKGKIVVSKNGPYLVSGNLPLANEIIIADEDGNPLTWKKGKYFPDRDIYALCRCGNSKNKPYSDGTHAKTGFDCDETASRKKYIEQAEKTIGPELILTDAQDLCSGAKFCHRQGGTWELTENSDNKKSKEIAIQQACDCPSGRLVAWDKKTGKPIEPNFKQSASIVECPAEKVSGPIWVKGKVPVELSDGTKYETRNRMTLCRCGKSGNKPFCDGSHISAGFNDGDESFRE